MTPDGVSAELLLQIRRDRDDIALELESLALQNDRLAAAAAEDTLSGHLRQAVHASHRPLALIARDAGIDKEALLQFLEGESGLPSDTLDRVARAAGVVVTFAPNG
jgi:DNA-binding phage protein